MEMKLRFIHQYEAVANVQRKHREQKMDYFALTGAKHIRRAFLAVLGEYKTKRQLICFSNKIPTIAQLLKIMSQQFHIVILKKEVGPSLTLPFRTSGDCPPIQTHEVLRAPLHEVHVLPDCRLVGRSIPVKIRLLR